MRHVNAFLLLVAIGAVSAPNESQSVLAEHQKAADSASSFMATTVAASPYYELGGDCRLAAGPYYEPNGYLVA